jgi:tetratricopeptide (TPR) repeat protein
MSTFTECKLHGVRAAVCLAAILVGLPSTAAAQKDAFRDALIAFHSKLSSDYGDEGPAIATSLDAMSSSLAIWEAAIRTAEQESRQRLPAAALPDRVRIHSTLAELYVERGRQRDAIGELDAAIRFDSNRAALHVLRGLVLEAVGRQQDAVDDFRRAWEIDNDDPVSAYLLASRRSKQSDDDEISPQGTSLLKALDRRLKSMPSDRRIPLFAQLALVPDGAAVTPVFSPARYADGFALAVDGRYADAIASFRRAIAGDPLVSSGATSSERVQQSVALLRDGDAESAIPNLEAEVTSSPRSSELRRILGGAYADAGNDAKSIEHLEVAVAVAPDDERASVALGRELAHAGQPERAADVLRATIAKLPQSADARSALADLYESSRVGDAVRELEAAASLTVLAGKAPLYFRIADLHHRQLEYDRVIEPLTRRIRLNPNDARSHTDLGLAYTRVGRTADALIELVTASLIGPDDAEALTAIGQIHFDAGRFLDAEAVLRRAIAIAPTLLQPRYLLGHTLTRLGRTDEGKEQLAVFDRIRADTNAEVRRVFELDQLRQQAERETRAGRHDAAVATWQQIVEREPRRAEHRVAFARALLAAGRPPAAIVEELQAAASLDADDKVYRELAEIYSTLGKATESAAARQMSTRLLRERRREPTR